MQIDFEQTSQIRRASEIVIPDYMRNRLSTGIGWFDEALGSHEVSGFIAGSVFLLFAAPGGGKSTLMRQMSGMTELEVLYNCGEECFEQVKMSLDDKMFSSEFDLSNYRSVDDLLMAAEKHKYNVLVVDSLANLYSPLDHLGNELKAAPGSPKQLVTCAEKIAAYCKRTLTTAFLVCHSTKGGDFRGGQDLDHAGDATIVICVEEDVDDDGEKTLSRVLSLRKNRWGLTGVDCHLAMTAHGLSKVDAPAEDVQERQSKGRANGGVKTIARKLLADKLGCTKDWWVEELINQTDCRRETAVMYWSMLNRERIA